MQKLAAIFPSWEEKALLDVLLGYWGIDGEDGLDIEGACAIISEWSIADSEGTLSTTKKSRSGETQSRTVVYRYQYDHFMRQHLIREDHTPHENLITLKSAAKLLARAHLAKKMVALRRAQINCMSQIAEIPRLRSYSEEERKKEMERHMGTEESRMADGLELISQRLKFLQLREISMQDDGNCQFRALSHELYGHQIHHMAVREAVVAYLKKHPEQFEAFASEDWSKYIGSMSESRTWGDELTLRAACDCFAVSIYVVTTNHENWLIHYYPSGSVEKDDTRRCVFLLYQAPIHYNVIGPCVTEKL